MKNILTISFFIIILNSNTSFAECKKALLSPNRSIKIYDTFSKKSSCITFKTRQTGVIQITSSYPLYSKLYHGRIKIKTSKTYLTKANFPLPNLGWYYVFFFSENKISADVNISLLKVATPTTALFNSTTTQHKINIKTLQQSPPFQKNTTGKNEQILKTSIKSQIRKSSTPSYKHSAQNNARRYLSDLYSYSLCSSKMKRFLSRKNLSLIKIHHISIKKIPHTFIFTNCKIEKKYIYQVFVKKKKNIYKFRLDKYRTQNYVASSDPITVTYEEKYDRLLFRSKSIYYSFLLTNNNLIKQDIIVSNSQNNNIQQMMIQKKLPTVQVSNETSDIRSIQNSQHTTKRTGSKLLALLFFFSFVMSLVPWYFFF